MSRREDVPQLEVMDLADVAEALHEIADRLGNRGLQAGRLPNRAESRSGYYDGSDTSSTTSSRDQHRRQVPTTPKSEPNFNPPADYHKHRSTQRYVNAVGHPQDYPDTEPRITSHRLESIDSHRQGPRASSYRLEPRAPHFSDPRVGYHHSEPRASNHRAFDTRRDFGRGAQTSSPPPSPTPLPRALPHQPLPRPTRRCLTTSITGESRNHPQIPDPVYLVSDQLDLGDVFDLDDTYVRLRDPNCLRQIYVPPRGKQGPKNRWYIVCVGREVGVFNDWNDVSAATNGLSGNIQQSVRSEAAAYTAFKRALLQGKVWVAK